MDPLMDSRMGSGNDGDPNFTADISTQMRIPDRLSFAGPHPGDFPVTGLPRAGGSGDDAVVDMQLPDKIIVAGAERHIEVSGGMYEPFPSIIGNPDLQPAPFSEVAAPPSVLRVDAAGFREMARYEEEDDGEIESTAARKRSEDSAERHGDPERAVNRRRQRLHDLVTNRTTQSDSDFFEDETLTQLQQQLSRLQRRVDRLESEVGFTQQRDRILLPLLGVYAIYKIVRFLFHPRN